MDKFQQGQLVLIKRTAHSSPVGRMHDMIDKVYTIDEVYDRRNYVIRGFIWAERDLDELPKKSDDNIIKQFDVKNLVV